MQALFGVHVIKDAKEIALDRQMLIQEVPSREILANAHVIQILFGVQLQINVREIVQLALKIHFQRV